MIMGLPGVKCVNLSSIDNHTEATMRTMAYLLFLLGIAASEPAQLLTWVGIEIGSIIPLHPLIPAVQLFGAAVQAMAGG